MFCKTLDITLISEMTSLFSKMTNRFLVVSIHLPETLNKKCK